MDSTVTPSTMHALPARLEALGSADGAAAVRSASKLTDSAGASALESLVDELTRDGAVDKGDVNILKLFLDLLTELGDGTAPAAPAALPKGKDTGAGTPGGDVRSTHGSQAPPAPAVGYAPPAPPAAGDAGAGVRGVTDMLAGKPPAPPAASGAAPAAYDKKPPMGEGPPPGNTSAPPTGSTRPADAPAAKADKGMPYGPAEDKGANCAGKPAAQAGAGKPTESAYPAHNAGGAPTRTNGAPTGTNGAPPRATDNQGDKGAVRTYETLKTSALGDGAVSANEQKAVDAFAKKAGLDAGMRPSTGYALDQILKGALQDGSIGGTENDAISHAIDTMGKDSTLGSAQVQSMLMDFMRGAEKDGDFSDKDLATFDKLLSLMGTGPEAVMLGGAAAPGAQAAPNAQGSKPEAVPAQPYGAQAPASFADGVAGGGWAAYLFQTFMNTNGSGSESGGGIGGFKTEEDRDREESKS